MTRTGRPKKEEGDRKSETLRIRLTQEEKIALEKRAQADSMTLSAWARSRLLDLGK